MTRRYYWREWSDVTLKYRRYSNRFLISTAFAAVALSYLRNPGFRLLDILVMKQKLSIDY